MPIYATVTLPSVSTFPADDVVNTWVISGASEASPAADIDAYQEALAGFYTDSPPASALIVGEHISQVISRADPCIIRFYDLVDLTGVANFGSPFSTHNFTLPVPGGSAMPSEVSACLQLEAFGRSGAAVEAGVTRPKQRLTGRVFLGPLTTSVMSTDNGKSRVAVNFRTLCTNRAVELNNALAAVAGTAELAVWSRANAQVIELEAVSMNNAFDFQNRRGEKPDANTRVLTNP